MKKSSSTTLPIRQAEPIRPLVSAQIRAARALIRWSAEDLARASAVGVTTIRRAEITEEETALTAANDQAIRRAAIGGHAAGGSKCVQLVQEQHARRNLASALERLTHTALRLTDPLAE